MSNDDTQKADQIALHFYTKLFYVVNDARAIAEPRPQSKVDKWFNLETPDSDLFSKEAKEPYKSLSSSPPPPPLEIQVLLTIPDLTNNQVLVYNAPDTSRVRVEPVPKTVLLERWTLSFSPTTRGDYDTDESRRVTPPTTYKHGIPLFRSLYSLLRILPTWKLCKRLRRRGSAQVNRGNGLSIQVRVRERDDHSMLDFDVPPSPSHSPLPTSAHSFPSVPLPMGSLNLTATYLSTPNFRLDELESLLSSRFMSMDTGPEFTPTLVKNQQRDSLLSTHEGSPGSLPLRTSLPLSPPRDIVRPNSRLPSNSSRPISRATPEDAESIAERFVLPSRTASTGTSPPHLGQHRALPITRATTTTSTTTAGSSPSGALARLRKESLQRATTSDSYLPGSTSTSSHPFPSSVSSTSSIPPATSSPISVRRPALNPVNPFKSGTLSDRTSQASGLGLGFPTSGGIGSGAGTGGASGSPSSFSSSLRNQPSPMSSTGLPSLSNFPRTGGPPHSPIIPGSSLGTGTGIGKPSPPVEGGGSISSEMGGTTRKRYSSSFGHRYTSGGAGGPVVGSAGSVGSGSGSGSVGVGGIPPAGRMSVEGSPNPRPRELPGRHSRTSSLGQGVPMRAVEKEGSSSYMGTATDDDDISEFVQDIDSRKPLSGRSRILSGARKDSRPDSPVITAEPEAESESAPSPQAPTYTSHAQQPSSSSTTSTGTGSRTIRMPSGTIVPGTGSRASTLTIDSSAGAGTRTSTLDSPTRSPIDIRTFDPRGRTSRSSSLNQQVTAASPPAGSGPMLTSQTEVEDKLKKMNEMFLASLEGLGSGSGSGSSRQRGSAESSPVSSTRPPLSSGMGTGARPGMYHRRSGSGSGRGSPLPLMFTDRERRGSQGSEEVIGRLELSGK